MTEPKIRFKRDDGSSFPDWEEHELNYYLCVNADRNIKHEFDKEDVLSVSGEYGVVNQIEFQGRSFAGADVRNYHILYNGDIVYTKSPLKENPFGIIKYNDGPDGIVSTLYAVYHCKDNIVGKLIEYYFDLDSRLNNYLKPLVNIGAKHDMKINNETAISGTVILPSLPEQQKIADFLSNVDEAIAASEEEVANLEQQKKAMMQKIFSQEVRFKKEDGSDFPDWEEKKLEDILDYEQPTRYIVNNTDYSDDYSIPVLTAGQSLILGYTNEDNGIYNATKESPVIIFDDFTTSFHWIDFSFKVKSSAMKMLTLKSNDCVFKYVLNAMRNIEYSPASHSRQWIATYSQFFIPYPHPDEQQLIADFLTSYDEAITVAKQELEKWKELKKGLLQQMFV